MAVTPLPIAPGLRVRHRLSGDPALVIGTPESSGRYALVWVSLEGSTRRELWPVHALEIRPRPQQPVALGGRFKAPVGYPLRMPRTTTSTAKRHE
jgi:hypothetical protein